MAYDPSIFNINPYYDDFDAAKGFLRVLFKPGYALQARELTQAQSILQNQLSKVADHLFKDGSRILGGGITVRNADFVMVEAGPGTSIEGITDYSALVGGILQDTNGNKARIVHFLAPDPETDNLLVLVIDYLSGFSFSDTVEFVKEGEGINGVFLTLPQTEFLNSGSCKVVTVSDGIFYVDGFFVRVDTHSFSPFRVREIGSGDSVTQYRDLSFEGFTSLSKKIGFVVNRDTVNEQEDPSLRDPSIGSYNYNAPGADRYKIILSLDQFDIDATPNDFVELLRFDGGKITKKIDRVTYGDIMNALARRTFDESGSYTVKPFDVVIKPDQFDSNALSASVSSGKAYVLGYEVENQYPASVRFLKSRTLQTETQNKYPFSVGHQVGVRLVEDGLYGLTFTRSVVEIGSGSGIVKIFDGQDQVVAHGYVHGAIPNPASVNPVGTGRVGYEYNLYLYGISGNVAAGVCGYIYSHPDGNTYGTGASAFVNTEGITVAAFVSSSANENGTFVNRFTDYSSLVYPIEPGYAVDSIQSLRVTGKIIGNSAIDFPVQITTSNNVTQFRFNKSHFSSTILPNADSSFRFLDYGRVNSPSRNTEDLAGIAFIKSSDSGASQVLVPFGLDCRVYTNSDRSEVTVLIPSAPAEFQSGSVRAVCPIEYTPNITNQFTYRRKVSVEQTVTLSGIKQDENNRRYYEFPNFDVYAVLSVRTGTVDRTNDFELDDGQHCCFYDISRLYIKESVSREARYSTDPVSVSVTYRYFRHEGLASAPFIGKHSYDIPYDQIPLYTNPRNGKTVSLANCLDFRHSGITSSVPMIKPYGRSEFSSLLDTEITYTHYLPRVDKLCVKSDLEDGSPYFFVLNGNPDLSPSAPPDPDDGLVIATMTIPAYTHNPEDVVVTPVDTKRYTMGDIGKISKRIDEVEVFAKLSLSELEAESKSLKRPGEIEEPLKTSIFSDEFYGHSIADVNDDSFSCSIDYERGELRPFFKELPVHLPAPQLSRCKISADGIAMLDYTEGVYIDNKQYTKTVKINPSNTVNWLGFMSLSHSVEPYYDTRYRPIVRTNSLMENDNWLSANSGDANGFGTQWNSWDSIWTGIEEIDEEQDDIQKRTVEVPHSNSASAIQSFNSGNARVGTSRRVDSVDQKTSKFLRARQLKNRIKFKIGSRTVDRSVVPYIPGKSGIGVTVHGLKPNSENLVLYFDGEPVKSGITANANGSVIGLTFDIPAGKFLSGSRTVRISDSSQTANATISADAVYHCNGLLEQRDSGSVSTRPPELRRQLTASEAISKDPFNRDIDSIEGTHWTDPLSQTFFVDKKTNPDGVQISSVTLFFSSKDDTLPVTVQIRPTVGGYPSPSVVLPFSTVTLMPNEVTAEASPVGTLFTFSTPVYLEPGEYSICIITNSDNYSLFAAETAINAVENEDSEPGRAGNNQLVGTLYTSQGFGAAVPDPLTDIMFTVNRCVFEGSGSLSWYGSGGSPAEGELSKCIGSQVVKIYAPEVIPASCQITRRIGNFSFKNNDAVYPKTLYGVGPDIIYDMSRGYNVSPMIDLRAMYFAVIRMFEDSTAPRSRYVSRIVELPQEYAETNSGLAVFLDANLQGSSMVDVYCRYTVDGETDILQKQWVRMSLLSPSTPESSAEKPFTSTSEIDFRTAQYITSAPIDGMKSYQVRVDLMTESGYTYYSTPAIRNLKAVSFIR